MASTTKLFGEQGPCNIKFHWRKSVPCESSSVKLVVTSLTGTTVNLVWNPDSGGFESDVTALPLGLHSGYIIIQHTDPSIQESIPAQSFLQEGTIEKEFRVDPFFTSTKKKSIELFIEKSRAFESWRETPALRLRYLSSGNIVPQKYSGDRRKCQSNDELCIQLESGSAQERNVQESSCVPKTVPSTCVGEIPTNLKKWHSLGGVKEPSRKSFDSSYYSKSRSIAGEDLSKSQELIESITPSKSDGDAVNSAFVSQFPATNPKKSVLSETDLNFLKFQTYKLSKDVECLLDSSDTEPEQAPGDTGSQEKGYGCLITLESRSASMDDVGSPRALEEVLVSLTSSGTTEAIVAQLYEGHISPNTPEKHSEVDEPSECSFETSSGQEQSVCGPQESSEIDKTESHTLESEFSLNEDINFQYDSIKDNNESIPLKIGNLLESDSSFVNQEGEPSSLRISPSTSSGEGVSNNSCSELEVSNVGYYEIISKHDSESSARGEVATDSVRLVPASHLTVPGHKEQARSQEKSIKHSKKRNPPSDSSSSKSSKMNPRKTRAHAPMVRPIIARPISESVGVQTTSRIDPFKERRAKHLTKCTQSYFYAPSVANNSCKNDFSPLPNKADGPWSTKRRPNETPLSHFGTSDLRDLRKNLANLIKADKLLRKIHDIQDGMMKRSDHAASRSSVRFSEPLHRSQPRLDRSDFSKLESPAPRKYESSNRFRNALRSEFSNDDFVATHPNIYGLDRPYYPPSKLRSSQTSRYLRNMSSMPDLTSDVSDGITSVPSSSVRSRPKSIKPWDSSSTFTRRSQSTSNLRNFHERRSKPRDFVDHIDMESSSDDDSTDSLIDEINSLRRDMNLPSSNVLGYSKSHSGGRRSNYRRRNSMVPFSKSEYAGPTPPRSESSIGDIVRARSESDLRLVGPLTDGYQGEPPYLPYRKEQLSLGQVVKVLVPGGISLARVVYTPSNARLFPNYKPDTENITVVLISEPTKMIGSIVSVPLNQILLAWPKTRNIINF